MEIGRIHVYDRAQRLLAFIYSALFHQNGSKQTNK